MPTKKKGTSKRELIEPNQGDKCYVRREADGTFGRLSMSASRSPPTKGALRRRKCRKVRAIVATGLHSSSSATSTWGD